jgi:hypothetical protein
VDCDRALKAADFNIDRTADYLLLGMVPKTVSVFVPQKIPLM